MPLAAGARLGPYEVLSHLGDGGMGEVYRARDTRLDRTVALKVLVAAAASDPRRLERFRQEARAISRLSHSHICTLHDLGEQDGTLFLVMEHVQGRTLANRLDEGPLPIDEVLRYGAQIADALHAAHVEGVVHRDLKPANVMLTREGVKLLDFGVARLRSAEEDEGADPPTVSHLTEEGEVLGTVPYMAPEQLEGRKVDARTDVFALGTTLYEMATGKRPFAATSRAGVIAAILGSEPPAVSTLHPRAPPSLDWTVRRCLAKDPDDRWQSARDIAAHLRWILEGGAAAAGTTPMGTTPKRRGRGWLAGAAAVLLAVVVLGGLAARRFALPSPPRFHRLTYRPGIVFGGRFAPDGQTIVYSAAWQGGAPEMFLTRPGSAESRPLGLTDARILSVSRTGEMALLLTPDRFVTPRGTLARAPLAGGAPRSLLSDIRSADWVGEDLAVVRRVGGLAGKDVLEFPIGHKVHEAPVIWSVRVSPRGDLAAFFESPVVVDGDVVVVDRQGRVVTASRGWRGSLGLAWSPQGDEIWFTGSRDDDASALHAVSLSGRERVLLRGPDQFVLEDVLPDGRVLLQALEVRVAVNCLAPGETEEREMGWLEGSVAEDISSDGRMVLISEGVSGGGARGGVYVRRTDGSPAIRLGDGWPEALSPDGQWAFVAPQTGVEGDWRLLPTGVGSPRKVDRGPIRSLVEADWLADGRRIVLEAYEGDGVGRLYVLDVESGALRRLTDEPVSLPDNAAMPDGKSVILRLSSGRFVFFPVDGGEPRPIPHLAADDYPLQLSTDGRFLYVRHGLLKSAEIDRMELATGARRPWKTLSPRDPVGIARVRPVLLQPDGESYCYSYVRLMGDLFLVDGVH
jgi:eukaryotic-like serine/threonine-protein kinase